METALIDRPYSIGKPTPPTAPLTPAERKTYIDQLAALPAQLTAAARKACGVRLENAYRPGGWSGRQVMHHVADVSQNL